MVARVGVLCLLMLHGCAYQKSMREGRRAAADARWIEAYDAYEAAFALKAKDKARQGMDGVREQAVNAELDAANRHVLAREYEAAVERVAAATALDDDHPRIEAMRLRVQDAVLEDVDRHVRSEAPRAAYELTRRAFHLYPGMRKLHDARAVLRDRIVAEARAHADAGRFEDALAGMDLIAEFEPEEAELLGPVRAELVARWADAFADRAAAARRDRRYGLAGVLSARAYEIGRRGEDIGRARESLERAVDAATVRVNVESEGDGARHQRLARKVRTAVQALPNVILVWGDTWTLKGKLYAHTEQCWDSVESELHTKDYVKGTRQVPNPAYTELKAEQTTVLAELKSATANQQRANRDVTRIKARMADENARWDAAVAKRDSTAEALSTATQHLASVEKNEAELKIALEQKKGSAAATAAQAAYNSVTALLVEWRGRHERAQADAAEAADAFDELEAELGPRRKVQDAAIAELDALNARVAELTARSTDLKTKMEAIPATLTE